LSEQIFLDGECIHKLEYWVEDNLGNRWPPVCGWHTEFFYVDNTPPEIIKEVKCPKYQDDLPDGDWYITNNTKIEIDVVDQGTEPCIVGSTHLNLSIFYKNQWYYKTIDDPSGPISYDFTFEELAEELGLELADDCIHILRIWVEDNLHNKNTSHPDETFYVDNTPPVTNKTIDDPYCSLDADDRMTLTIVMVTEIH